MTISRSMDAPTRYKVVVGGWTLIVCRSSLLRALEAVAAILASLTLFFVGQAHALRERGYEAIGGEYLFLALPVLYYLLRAVLKDYIADLRGPVWPKPIADEWDRWETRNDLHAAVVQAAMAPQRAGISIAELSSAMEKYGEVTAQAPALARPMTDIAFLAPTFRIAELAYRQFLRDNNLLVSAPHRQTWRDGSRITLIVPGFKEYHGRRFDQVIAVTDKTGLLPAETAAALEKLGERATGRVPEEFFVQFYDMDAEPPRRDECEDQNV